MRSEVLSVLLLVAACTTSPPASKGDATSGGGGGGGLGGGVPVAACPPSKEGPIVAVDVAAFESGAMAALSDGSVWCWGRPFRPWRAVCGVVVDEENWADLPRRRTTEPCVDRLFSSDLFAAAVGRDGALYGWGEVTGGEVVPVTTKPRDFENLWHVRVTWSLDQQVWTQPFQRELAEPESFPFAADLLFHRETHQFLVLEGQLYGVGENTRGALGDGTQESRPEPVALGVPRSVVDLDCSSESCCALTNGGDLWCWEGGAWPDGQPTIEPSTPTPTRFDGLPRLCGFEHHTFVSCGWTCDGEVTCWGENWDGILQPQDDPLAYELLTPRRMPDLEPASKVVIGGAGPICALKTDGTVWCRGFSGNGDPRARPGDPAHHVEFTEGAP